MASDKAVRWVERMSWTLIYGGLFSVVIGLATLERHPPSAWSLVVAGGLVAVAGVVLIWVRSRMHNELPHKAQGKAR